MIKAWDDDAWEDYLYWQSQNKKTLKRINTLLHDIDRNDMAEGIGKPEPLRGNLSGWWSRRIDDANRIVYRIQDNRIESSSAGLTTGTNNKAELTPETPRPLSARYKKAWHPSGYQANILSLIMPSLGPAERAEDSLRSTPPQ